MNILDLFETQTAVAESMTALQSVDNRELWKTISPQQSRFEDLKGDNHFLYSPESLHHASGIAFSKLVKHGNFNPETLARAQALIRVPLIQ